MKINGVKVNVDHSVGFALVAVILPQPNNEEEAVKVKELYQRLQGPSGGSPMSEQDAMMHPNLPKDRTLIFTGDSWTYSVPYYNHIS